MSTNVQDYDPYLDFEFETLITLCPDLDQDHTLRDVALIHENRNLLVAAIKNTDLEDPVRCPERILPDFDNSTRESSSSSSSSTIVDQSSGPNSILWPDVLQIETSTDDESELSEYSPSSEAHRPLPARPPWMTVHIYSRCVTAHDQRILRRRRVRISCRGCSKNFFKFANSHGTLTAEFDFYVHCITKCPKYRALGLISSCRTCGFKFLTKTSLNHHLNNGGCYNRDDEPFTRTWMTQSLLRQSTFSQNWNLTINCQGCFKTFPSRVHRGTRFMRLDYYVHVVEECAEFRNICRVYRCSLCEKIYLHKIPSSHSCGRRLIKELIGMAA